MGRVSGTWTVGLVAALSVGLVTLFGLRLAGPRSAAGLAPKRVVVVVVDTLRRDHLPFYGYARDTAPFLSGLARESVVFEQAFSTSSWTAPSTASLFTSLYPVQHGVTLGLRATRKLMTHGETSRLNRIPEAAETLPEALARAGYAGFGLTQNVNISRELGFAQGFARFVNQPADDSADVLHARLMAWRRRLAEHPRHFLYLHYLDPHSPYQERAPWFDPTTRGRQRLVSAYDSEIAYVDQHLRLAYEALGWAEDTLLVVTADHGEEFWEHGSVEHGRTLFGEVVNVPLLVRFPGGRFGGQRVTAPVSLIDVLPTLREAVGLPRSPQDMGRSLLPLVEGRALPERTLFLHLERPEPTGTVRDLRGSLAGGLKLIEGGPAAPQPPQLYDLQRDPLDQDDLAGRQPAGLQALLGRAALFERSARRLAADATEVTLDPEAQERLRALGYVE